MVLDMAVEATRLQWVQGQVTLVMRDSVVAGRRRMIRQTGLQWVHGQITVVMPSMPAGRRERLTGEKQLQWVHGQITVVIAAPGLRWPAPVLVLQWVHGRVNRGSAHCYW